MIMYSLPGFFFSFYDAIHDLGACAKSLGACAKRVESY